MSVLVDGGLTEANIHADSAKGHNGGQDTFKRVWFAGQRGTAHYLTLYSSIDKFSTNRRQQLTNIPVSGGSNSDVRPYKDEYRMFVDAENFIHLFWIQETTHNSLTATRIYHLYGKITNNSGDITWYPIRDIRGSSDQFNMGDIVAFIAPGDSNFMTVHFCWSIKRTTSTNFAELHFETSKFSLSSPGSYTGNVNSTTIYDTGVVSEQLRPVMQFRQAGIDEKTPHSSAPHLYIATSSPEDKTRWYRGSYGFTGGNITFSWTNTVIRSGRWVSGSQNGIDMWHQIIWDGTNPVWFGQVRNNTDMRMHADRMSATSLSILSSYDNDVLGAFDGYGDGVAWYNPGDSRLYFAGIRNDGDCQVANLNLSSGTFTNNIDEFDTVTQDTSPEMAVNPTNEYGYNVLLYVRKNTSDYAIRAEVNITTNNHTPSTPTNLQVTSDVTDNTPAFQCDVTDVDLLEQIKARFTIYESDGTTVVATTDSSFRSGPGTVSKEYSTALPGGAYKVSAKAIDDSGATSAETAKIDFSIQSTASIDTDLLLNVAQLDSIDVDLILDIESSSTLDIDLSVDVAVDDQIDIDLILDIDTGWIPDTIPTTLWTEVVDYV